MQQEVPPITKRIDLNMGYRCNLRCRFCYYLKRIKKSKYSDLTTEECKSLIKFYFHRGMRTLEFTGGEPTIRKDLFKLVRYAQDEVGFPRLSIITNGIRLADIKYSKNLVRMGVKDFLFSLHGSSAKLHDYITRVSGSYKLLLKAIENLLGLGVKVRCNSVVTAENLYDLYERAKLFKQTGIKIVNFIVFNPLEEASKYNKFVPYSQVATYVRKIIDEMHDSFEKLTIRYIPFCVMKGYEQYVQNVHQVHYDHDEWNYYLRSYIREPYWKWFVGLLVGLSLLPGKRVWSKRGWEQAKHVAILEAHSWLNKVKLSPCKRCRYKFICGGVWKKYANHFGRDGLISQKGSILLEPWYFMTEAQRAVVN